ncbi:ABC transporter related [Desulfofarcimen acetoxidans DSM 771]|uniref:ABC transporter related n=1 Tax=Desulfofarcimen acetoxidans (strain ATCC 49208 / DSM 771 / KCTC 5769 / VKM B-1644 / 5575) TaxID=485916 RepID=C8VZA6_DESAS|nr:metal ABC transporter ATP-binding protein [Desulfofarcimen acetoxidans]ACV64851.1 ABC transporter related [Desulfofarcimen acetoxidans DSM 771]
MEQIALVEIKNLYYSFTEKTILEAINLEVYQGDYLALIGPNGSGKTTLLKLILGLYKPLRGDIKLFGQDIGQFRDWPRVGYVPQKATHFDHRFPATVEEVVAAGRFGRVGVGRRLTAADKEVVRYSLELVGMRDNSSALIGRLSGGQQQRVFIARALAGSPELLILDEPVVGLDAGAQERFYSMLSSLNKDQNMTLITVSHDTGAIGAQVNKLACINRRLIYHGSPLDIPAGETLASLYGMAVRAVSHHH